MFLKHPLFLFLIVRRRRRRRKRNVKEKTRKEIIILFDKDQEAKKEKNRSIISKTMKFLERLRWIFFNIFITISLAIFLLITIGCSRNVLQKNRMGNATKMDEDDMVESFLGLIYFFHLFCFFLAAFIHLFLHFKSSSNPHRTKSAFFR